MKILIVAATPFELAPLLACFNDAGNESLAGLSFRLNESTLDVLISGVGIHATSFALGSQLAQYKYDLAINLGIAGGFDQSRPLGESVLVSADRFADLGAQDGASFLDLFDLRLAEADSFPYESGWLCSEAMKSNPVLSNLRSCKGITVNTVHGEEKGIADVVKRYTPDIESMEGAAFFYACKMSDTACIQIRSVSNYVEKRNRERWDIQLALQSLTNTGLAFIESIV
jgi:futalosine hydrolase